MKKILIVEDDKLLQKVYTDEFSDFELVTVDTADRAIDAVSREIPDLVLLDVMLPGGKNGFDVLEFLKKNPNFQKIPVIMMTNLETEKETALSIGANDYIIKAELDLGQLRKKIEAIL